MSGRYNFVSSPGSHQENGSGLSNSSPGAVHDIHAPLGNVQSQESEDNASELSTLMPAHDLRTPTSERNLLSQQSSSPRLADEDSADPVAVARRPNPNTRRSLQKYYIHFWWMEIGALILSIATFGTAIGLLRWQQDKQLSAWTFSASLNTIIAIIGTISRLLLAFSVSACIGQQKWNWLRIRREKLVSFEYFDAASRSPMGAARLAFFLKLRHWAALGAFAMVIFIAFDPFLQATISYTGELDSVNDTSTAQTGRLATIDLGLLENPLPIVWAYYFLAPGSNASTSADSEKSMYGIAMTSPISQPDIGLGAAFQSGFAGLASARRLPDVKCDTGNCTWPPFTSAAICSSCHDVSDQVVSRIGEYYDDNPVHPFNVTYYQLPGSVEFTNLDLNVNPYDDDPIITLAVLNATSYPSETLSFKDFDTILAVFSILQVNKTWSNTRMAALLANSSAGFPRWNESKPIGLECGLYFCVNEYQTSVQSGQVVDNIVQSVAKRGPGLYGWPEGNGSENITSQQKEVYTAWLNESAGALWRREGVPYFEGIMDTATLNLDLVGPSGFGNSSFRVTQDTVISSIQFLLDWSVQQKGYVVDAGIGRGNLTFANVKPNQSQDIIGLVNSTTKLPTSKSTDLLHVLYRSPDIGKVFEYVAQMASSYIRSSDQAEQVAGETSRWTTHTRIRWPFLVVPALALLCSCIYVGLVIWETARLDLPAWKAASLPAFAYGFNEETQELLREGGQNGNWNEVGRSWMVSFHNKDGGLRLGAI